MRWNRDCVSVAFEHHWPTPVMRSVSRNERYANLYFFHFAAWRTCRCSRADCDCRRFSDAAREAVPHRRRSRSVAGVIDAGPLLLPGNSHAPEPGSLAHLHRRAWFPHRSDHSRFHCHELLHHFVAREHFYVAGCFSPLRTDSALARLCLLFGRVWFRMSCVFRLDAARAVTISELVVGLKYVSEQKSLGGIP